MWKKNFKNLKTHRVYGGVDHSYPKPPIQFERLGSPPNINTNNLKNRNYVTIQKSVRQTKYIRNNW